MFERINQEKTKYEASIKLGYTITILAFILYIPLGVSIGFIAFFIVGIPFIGGGIIVGRNYKLLKKLSNEFKEKYLSIEVQKAFPGSEYYYNRGFSETEVIESGLLFKQDRYHSEDLISGNFEGVSFKSSDVKQEDVRSDGERTTVVTIFHGRFYEFDFPKTFKSNLLLVQPRNFRSKNQYTRIKTESLEFNSELKIYAKNEYEAFYILTPNFMERLLYLDKLYRDKISFSFKNNRLYIAIDTREDHFDIKPFKKVDENIFKKYRKEMMDIKDFVKVLQLDETLFI
jgi:hypothetical protein